MTVLVNHKEFFLNGVPKANSSIYIDLANALDPTRITPKAIYTAVTKDYYGLKGILGIPGNATHDMDSSQDEDEYSLEDPNDKEIERNHEEQTFTLNYPLTEWRSDIGLELKRTKRQNKTLPTTGWTDKINLKIYDIIKINCKMTYNFVNLKTLCCGECVECGATVSVDIVNASDSEVQCSVSLKGYNETFNHSKRRRVAGE
jgi:hypothetical protein